MYLSQKSSNVIFVILSLIAWLYYADAKKSKKHLCPEGFRLAYTKNNEEPICYLLKGPETFEEKFKDCSGNRYTFKLMSELDFVKPKYLKLWTEYKTAYPGGPFIDWSFTESTGDLLSSSYSFNITFDPVLGLDEECLYVEFFEKATYSSARCNSEYYRYCMVEPYPEEQSVIDEGCEEFGLRFYAPRPTCLSRVEGLNGGTVRATWRQAQELCAKRGGSLIQRGWRYANHPLLRPTITPRTIPLGALVMGQETFIWSNYEDGNNMIQDSDLQYLESFDSNKTGLGLKFNINGNISWIQVNSSALYFDVTCERSIHLRSVDMNVHVLPDRTIRLVMNDTVDDDDIYCFTDSAAYYPKAVEIEKENDTVYELKRVRSGYNGYYWCIHFDSQNYRVSESNRALYLRKDRSLQNLYAIKIRTSEDYSLNDLNKLYKFWERNLKEYILCRTRFYELYGDKSITDEEFKREFSLKKFSKARPDLKWRVNVIESLRLKRVFRDNRTVLLHVDLSPEMRPATPGLWEDLEVLYMKPTYYCQTSNNYVPLGESQTQGCYTQICVGDFNEGVQWVNTATAECTSRTVEVIESAVTVDEFSTTVLVEDKERQVHLGYLSTSDSSEETTTDIITSTTTSTPESTVVTEILETLSTVDSPLTIGPRPPPSRPTTTTTSIPPTTTIPPPLDKQLQQVLDDLENLVNNDTVSVHVEDIEDAFDRVDVILDAEEELQIPSELLHLLDQLGARTDLNGSQQASAVRGNIAMLLADASPTNPVRGIRIATRDTDVFTNQAFEIISQEVNSTHLTTNESEAVVHLPESVAESNRRISFVIFRNDRAFQSDHEHFVVNSRVLSVKVEELTEFQQGEVVDIHLRPITNEVGRNMSRACAYWHFVENGSGYWSQEGCTYIPATEEGLMDTCRCDHLTHFAEILVPRTIFSERNERILEIVSIVGCCVSIFGLFLIGLTALLFRSWRRDFNNKIWLHLCLAIFLLALCFLIVTFANFQEYNVLCMLTGIALHYSVLSSFCWMLVAAVLSYRRLVLVFTREASHKLLRASAFSWGVPCAVIGILLSISPHSYAGRFEEKTPSGSFCYPSDLALWLSVYAPIALMLLANWTLFILIVRSVFASKRVRRHGDTNEIFRCASVSCLLVFLFGLPWLFGLFAYNIVSAYFFTLTSTFQGFVLFLFFVVFNKKTRDLWLNKLKIKQTRKIPVTSSTYTNKSTGSGWQNASTRPRESPETMVANSSKPRSLASPDDSRFS